MKSLRYLFAFSAAVLINCKTVFSQNTGEIHGNFQSDVQYYIPDTAIGADTIPEKTLMNAFANIIYTKDKFSAGIRFESYHNALLGFDSRYVGNGIPYRYATYKADELEVTVGNFYEQFGNGLIFRTYEERGLGLDNVMDGIRVKFEPCKGIYLKGLVGKQRLYFSQGPGILRGFDGDMQVNETFKKFAEKKTQVIIGGSFISKFQAQPTGSQYIFPENVGASAGRLNIIHGGFRLSSEYAKKINDPSNDNGFIYKEGQALLLMTSYAKKGFSITLNAKHVDNMGFRSDRNATTNDLLISYAPALCMQHTYLLAALYPYASQSNGEIAFQSEIAYKFKKGTKLGGEYGTEIKVNYSGANSLDTTWLNDMETTRKGYETNFWGIGKQIYFRDFVIELNKKFNKKFKGTLMYTGQNFNIDVVQGKDGTPNILSNTFIADFTYKLTSDRALRMELQSYTSNSDHVGDWAAGLVELTLGTHWYVAVVDMYNYGEHTDETGHKVYADYNDIHFVSASAGYIKNANRISLGYGKQRAGVFCVGGVCRTVPASNGIILSITSSF